MADEYVFFRGDFGLGELVFGFDVRQPHRATSERQRERADERKGEREREREREREGKGRRQRASSQNTVRSTDKSCL